MSPVRPRASKYDCCVDDPQRLLRRTFIVAQTPLLRLVITRRAVDYCDECVCLSVCPRAYLQNYMYMSNVHWIFVQTIRWQWSWIGYLLEAYRYATESTSDFMDDVVFAQMTRKCDAKRRSLLFKVTRQAAAQNWIHKLTRQEQHWTGGEDWYPRLPCGGNVDLLCTTNTLKSARAAFYRAYLFIRECCSRCRFQSYDCIIIRFVE